MKINLSTTAQSLPLIRSESTRNLSMIASAGRERILVVEDEIQVLRFIGLALGRFGYEVLEASDGEEALAIVASQTIPIDLLLTDVCLPNMTGVDLAAGVKEQHPGQLILFMTGYADPFQHDQPPSSRLIQKPFTPRELNHKIKHLLARAVRQRGYPAAS